MLADGCYTHLLASTRVESHHHSVHERDIELFGEVENALRDCKSRRETPDGRATYLHSGKGIDGRVTGVVVVVVDVELLTEPRRAKGCGGRVGRGRDLRD